MESELPLQQIEVVDFFVMNHKQFFDEVLNIKEIEDNIIQNEKENKGWIDFAVVENHIHKSGLLDKFASIFQTYRLQVERYSTQKCMYKRNKKKEIEMSCPEIIIKMKKTD